MTRLTPTLCLTALLVTPLATALQPPVAPSKAQVSNGLASVAAAAWLGLQAWTGPALALDEPVVMTPSVESSSTVTAAATPTIAAGRTQKLIAATPEKAALLNNDYADPLHPYCRRRITASPNGKSFHFIGTLVTSNKKGEDVSMRGCSPEETAKYTLKSKEFDGYVFVEDTATQNLVLSVGDGVHEGIWEAANTASNAPYADLDGIRWNDGNKWIVSSQTTIKKLPAATLTASTTPGAPKTDKKGPPPLPTYVVVAKDADTLTKQGIFAIYVGLSAATGAGFLSTVLP
eukprot:CAMPEP_0172438900 /NCGR_PEP_ID=MMETSP1065-20121228/25_1 /TAXON_ID=265537 /ORGANISM="Amphiprora paludosa, Strain CCMP125" /LENGTH=288 /DNA_ID=CAMNT_0013187495 /DNA_START=43 /DNA_END=909 /DNA_ORIENTATION=+